MIINTSYNNKLYGLKENFNEIANLYNKKTFPNKILLSGKKGLGKSTLGYHLINYILSINEVNKYDQINLCINEDNKSFKLIKSNSHPNFYLIDLISEKKSIDIDQIRQMISYNNKSSFNNHPRFVLIDNIENLNKNSLNALLKILEEPNENLNFILIHNCEKKTFPTLISRCLTFKINFSFKKSIEISNLILEKNLLDLINYDLINYYSTPGEFVNLIKFAETKKINLKDYKLIDFIYLLINNAYYKKDKYAKDLIINSIQLYFLKIYKMSSTKKALFNAYHDFIFKVHNTETYNLDYENLFLQFKSKY